MYIYIYVYIYMYIYIYPLNEVINQFTVKGYNCMDENLWRSAKLAFDDHPGQTLANIVEWHPCEFASQIRSQSGVVSIQALLLGIAVPVN